MCHLTRSHTSALHITSCSFFQCHSNESICSVRQKVAKQLNVTPEQVQIGTTEHWVSWVTIAKQPVHLLLLSNLCLLFLLLPTDLFQLDISDYNKLIHQLGFTDHQTLIVKTQSFVSSSSYVRTEVHVFKDDVSVGINQPFS